MQGGGATFIFISVRTKVVAPLILISVYREDVETIHQVLFVKWMFERVKLSWEGKTEMKTNECGSFFIQLALIPDQFKCFGSYGCLQYYYETT